MPNRWAIEVSTSVEYAYPNVDLVGVSDDEFTSMVTVDMDGEDAAEFFHARDRWRAVCSHMIELKEREIKRRERERQKNPLAETPTPEPR
jgi:hypothetical protein